MASYWTRLLSAWRASRLATTLGNSEVMRFALAGGINTLVGFTVYALAVVADLRVALALFLGMLAGTFFNFFTNGAYVFRQLRIALYPRFVACYLLVYGLNVLFMNVFLLWMSNKLIIQAILTIPLAMLSYLIMSRLVFITDNGRHT